MGRRGSQGVRVAGCAVLALASVGGCKEAPPSTRAEDGTAVTTPEPYLPAAQPDLCAETIDHLRDEASLPGAPGLEEHRAEILARARAVPVVFHTVPGPPASPTLRVAQMRRSLLAEDDPTEAILQVLRKTRGNYAERREVFLTDQYLYAEKPLLALRLSQVLRLDHLFSKTEQEIVIERGTETIVATRSEGRYWLPPIADADPNKRHHLSLAGLLLFDRVRLIDEEFGPPLHVDLRALQRALGFSSAKIGRITAQGMVAELTTYGARSQALISWEGPEARLVCETRGSESQALAEARAEWHRDQDLMDPVLEAAHEMIFRALPFDEPKTEEGQQDGLLRIHFRQAYRQYQSTYEFNGDSYYVFDGYGRPRLPQVCIDFITDAFDWGTGGHWPERGNRRDRVKGALHFASLGMENARSVENLAEFATETPEWFDVVWTPKSEQVKFRHRTKFFAKLKAEAETYRRGDIVFIYGLRDDGKFHYHSFLIDEKDPVTGMPTQVAANAGPPQVRSWEGEMQNAPLRAVVARVRVRRELLLEARRQAKQHPGVPLEPPTRPEKVAETPSVAVAREELR